MTETALPSAWAILLTGSSSAGKTSLARALQQQVVDQTWLFVADNCFPAAPPGAHESRGDSPIVVFHRGIGVWLAAGYNVILDGSLPYGDPNLHAACIEELRAAGDLYLIGVTATVDELGRRERGRPDARQAGWAVRQHADVNEGLELTGAIDTSSRSPAECAADVLHQLESATARRWM